MHRKTSYTIYLTIALLLLGTSLTAADLPSPIKALQDNDVKVQQLLAEQPGTALSSGVRAQVKQHINAVFDFAELARLALGQHWDERSAAERAHFSATFEGIISEQNLTRFVKYYREGKIDYQNETVDGTHAEVNATVPVREERIGLVYRLHAVDGRWRVYDLLVDDLSTAESNRTKFERYINKHSYEKLIQQLEKQQARLQDQAAEESQKADVAKAAATPPAKPASDTETPSTISIEQAAPKTEPLDFTLAPGKAGAITIGMAVDQIYAHFDRTQTRLVDRQYESKFTPAIALHPNPDAAQASLIALIHHSTDSGWTLGNITVSDPRYKTAQGIGVGSVLEQLRAHHTVTTINSKAKDARLSIGIETSGIHFVLNTQLTDLEDVTLEQLQADPSLVPNTARILFVQLTH
jgi:phospholipid transport system substrate-binding protein